MLRYIKALAVVVAIIAALPVLTSPSVSEMIAMVSLYVLIKEEKSTEMAKSELLTTGVGKVTKVVRRIHLAHRDIKKAATAAARTGSVGWQCSFSSIQCPVGGNIINFHFHKSCRVKRINPFIPAKKHGAFNAVIIIVSQADKTLRHLAVLLRRSAGRCRADETAARSPALPAAARHGCRACLKIPQPEKVIGIERSRCRKTSAVALSPVGDSICGMRS